MKMRKIWAVAAVAGALVAGALGASCGGPASHLATFPPAKILATTVKALRSATSMRFSATLGRGSHATRFDMASFSNGDLAGTIVEGGHPARYVVAGGTDYVKAGAAYWISAKGEPSSAAKKMANVWVSIPDADTRIGQDLSIAGFATALSQGIGTLRRGAAGRIGGLPVIAIDSSSGETIWVATSGPAYPVKVAFPGGSGGGGVVVFSAWNKNKPPTAPTGALPFSSFGTPPPQFPPASSSPPSPGAPSSSTSGTSGPAGSPSVPAFPTTVPGSSRASGVPPRPTSG